MTAQRKRRRPLLAAVLSLLVPGLGELYNGQLKRALVFFGACAALTHLVVMILLPSLFAEAFAGFVGAVSVGLALVGLRILNIVHAFRSAMKIRVHELRRYNRWYVYVAVVAVAPLAFSPFRTRTPLSYHIPSHGMAPTVDAVDFIAAAPIADRDRPPERGDVVILRLAMGGEEFDSIERMVGLPGDRVQMRGGVLHINGVPVRRERVGDYALDLGFVSPDRVAMYRETLPNGVSYHVLERTDAASLDDTPELTVPPGHYFVLGDNRDASLDSRSQEVGFVPAGNLIGRATYIWYSTAARDAGILEVWKWLPATRLDRIGARIR